MRRKQVLWWAGSIAFILLVCLWVNWRFGGWTSPKVVLAMNDVPSIVDGYRATSSFLNTFDYYYRGTWIEKQTHVYRPLSGQLYWLALHAGLRCGSFYGVAVFGFVLFFACCLLTSFIAWQIWQREWAAAVAGIISAAIPLFNSGHPRYWTVWFPCHQELAFGLTALAFLSVWLACLRRPSGRLIVWAYVLHVVSLLFKETAYILPLMAALAAWTFPPSPVSVPALAPPGLSQREQRRRVMLAAAGFFALVIAAYLLRGHLVADPRNPTLVPEQFVAKPLDFLAAAWFRHLYGNTPMLRAMMIIAGVLFLTTVWGKAFWHRCPGPDSLKLALVVLITVAALTSVGVGIGEIPWLFFAPTQFADLFMLWLTPVNIWLIVRLRKLEPTLLVAGWLFLIHMPILDYIGWHYTLVPDMFWGFTVVLLIHLYILALQPVLAKHTWCSWLCALALTGSSGACRGERNDRP